MVNMLELEKVMTFIQDHPEKHDQRVWITECGTAACMAGWAAVLNGWEMVPHINGGWVIPVGSASDMQAVQKALAKWRSKRASPEGSLESLYHQWCQEMRGLGVRTVREVATEIFDITDDESSILFSGVNTVEMLALMVKTLGNGDRLRNRFIMKSVMDDQGRWKFQWVPWEE